MKRFTIRRDLLCDFLLNIETDGLHRLNISGFKILFNNMPMINV